MSIIQARKLNHSHIGKTIYLEISPVDLVGIRRVDGRNVELTVSECGDESKVIVAAGYSVEIRD
jgi:hypothetical protein